MSSLSLMYLCVNVDGMCVYKREHMCTFLCTRTCMPVCVHVS